MGDCIEVLPDGWVFNRREENGYLIVDTDGTVAEELAFWDAPGMPDDVAAENKRIEMELDEAEKALVATPAEDFVLVAARTLTRDALRAQFEAAMAIQWPMRRYHLDLDAVTP